MRAGSVAAPSALSELLQILALHPAEAKRPMRFDVVAISLDGGDNALRWIRAAFDAA